MIEFKACLHCGSTRFFDGPRGGASMNVTCCKCGTDYNILLHPGAPVMMIEELTRPRYVIDLAQWKPQAE